VVDCSIIFFSRDFKAFKIWVICFFSSFFSSPRFSYDDSCLSTGPIKVLRMQYCSLFFCELKKICIGVLWCMKCKIYIFHFYLFKTQSILCKNVDYDMYGIIMRTIMFILQFCFCFYFCFLFFSFIWHECKAWRKPNQYTSEI